MIHIQSAHKHHREAGFTLIELMIVVVVIGILASIAIPNYFSMTENTRRASCISNQRNLVGHATLFAADNGIQTGDVSVADLEAINLVPSEMAECPNSMNDDWDDYIISFVDGVVTDVTCDVVGEDHEWTP